ncbi:hypothetical protein SAMN02745161_0355 [Halodesulfovibrio marinisediminis DSM 17456]|uniref:Uncharacterized protein n=2 Tax=Halodesulfovibrio marinisediminis TaxID=458711 RepID=A0A1N6DP68_9BACT|nr:hypothetical protein SAMN02745161_0355 [Halodesulfovibrio marinisediminis DSM 17456]
MKTLAYEKNIERLKAKYRTFSNVARYMRMDVRHFRYQRRTPNKFGLHRVSQATKIMRLRMLLNVLCEEYGISRDTMAEAMRKADARIMSGKS